LNNLNESNPNRLERDTFAKLVLSRILPIAQYTANHESAESEGANIDATHENLNRTSDVKKAAGRNKICAGYKKSQESALILERRGNESKG
jgi:hypothetical protein